MICAMARRTPTRSLRGVCQRFTETVHRRVVVAKHAQRRPSRQIDGRRPGSGLIALHRHRLSILLRQLHVPHGLLPVSQLSVRTGQHCVGGSIVRSQFLRDLQFVNRVVVPALGIQDARQRQMKRRIVRAELQRQAIFARGFRELTPLSVGCPANQVDCFRIAQRYSRPAETPSSAIPERRRSRLAYASPR